MKIPVVSKCACPQSIDLNKYLGLFCLFIDDSSRSLAASPGKKIHIKHIFGVGGMVFFLVLYLKLCLQPRHQSTNSERDLGEGGAASIGLPVSSHSESR